MDERYQKASIDLIKSLIATPDQSPLLTLQKLVHCPLETSPFCYPMFEGGFPDASPQKILLPSTSTEDQPVFVNPKQYHRILKRRIARSKQRPVRRTAYLHESRHKHACKRKRDDRGMFISKPSFSAVADRFKAQQDEK